MCPTIQAFYLKFMGFLKPRGDFLITVPHRYNANILFSLIFTGKGIGEQEYDNPPKPSELARGLKRNGFLVESCQVFCPIVNLTVPIVLHVISHARFVPWKTRQKIQAFIQIISTERFKAFTNSADKCLHTTLVHLPVFLRQLYVFVQSRKVDGFIA